MNADKAGLVRTWLAKARSDLASAAKLASGADAFLDTAIFHCQQAAEKALKAYLVFVDRPFGKTHDLRYLIELAKRSTDRFQDWQDAADLLTPLAIAYRYPESEAEPTPEQFSRAYEAAGGILGFVVSILPPAVTSHSTES